jgi:hypothetical protein
MGPKSVWRAAGTKGYKAIHLSGKFLKLLWGSMNEDIQNIQEPGKLVGQVVLEAYRFDGSGNYDLLARSGKVRVQVDRIAEVLVARTRHLRPGASGPVQIKVFREGVPGSDTRLHVRTFDSGTDYDVGEGLRLIPGDTIQMGQWDYVTVRNLIDGAMWHVAAEQREGRREFHVWPRGVKPPWGEDTLAEPNRNAFVSYGVSILVSFKRLTSPYSSLVSGGISYIIGMQMDDELTWARADPHGTVLGFESGANGINVYLLEGSATVRGERGEPVKVGEGEAVRVTRNTVSRPARFTRSRLSPALNSALQSSGHGGQRNPVGIPIPRARVTAVRFFGGGSQAPPREQRRYAKRFSSSQNYLWAELHLTYPPPGSRIAFPIRSVWRGPTGKVLAQRTLESSVEPQWNGSLHSHRWQPAGGESWETGTYRVDFFVGGQKVAGGSFEIKEENAVSAGLPIPGARVTGLRFYEGGLTEVPLGKRAYVRKFQSASTRYVYRELQLEYPPPGRRIQFEIQGVWYRADGSVLARQSQQVQIEPHWTSTYHAHGWGSMLRGGWTAGVYRVELFIAGQKVASGSFEVQGRGPGLLPSK